MTNVIKLLKENKDLTNYRVVENDINSYELFFVKGKLETVRATDTLSQKVTVYVKHGDFMGDSSFEVLQSDDDREIERKIKIAAERANLVFNKPYELPPKDELDKTLPSNLDEADAKTLGAKIAEAVFAANNVENCSLNAVEIFIYNEKLHILNGNGVDKTQRGRRVMIEAIPTFTNEKISVELYEDYRFTEFDAKKVTDEIARKLHEVKDRALAKKPETPLTIDILLRNDEIASILEELAYTLNYSAVYSHATPFKIGDKIQPEGDGDRLNVTMKAIVEGSENSAYFDKDGFRLKDTLIIKDGVAENYHGSFILGQYLDIKEPSGSLNLIRLEKGSLTQKELNERPYLECVSLSGIQLDIFNDYIGGEIRLAYLCKDGNKTPVTSITMSAKLSEVMKTLKLSEETDVFVDYEGPKFMLLKDVTVL